VQDDRDAGTKRNDQPQELDDRADEPGRLAWWLSGALVPQFKTVAIVPRTNPRSGASTPTAAVQRHGPQATSAAAASRMNGPGGIVGNPSTPEKYWVKIPAAATTSPVTFTLAAVERVVRVVMIRLCFLATSGSWGDG
jgi:hypothetical protein